MLKFLPSFALMMTAGMAFAQGEVIAQSSDCASDEILADYYKMGLGSRSDSIEHSGKAFSAAFVNKRGDPIGLTASQGYLMSENPRGWDGIMLSAKTIADDDASEKRVSIFPRSDVRLFGRTYDLTQEAVLDRFRDDIDGEEVGVVQLPLIIRDGQLDLKPSSEKAIRRIAFQTSVSNWKPIGIYQTNEAMTLYDAAKALLAHDVDGEITYAVNLPMGAHDYCMEWGGLDINACGKNNLEKERPLMFLSFKYYYC